MEELTKRKSELKEIFVKKYKVSSEISTPSFNEKDNEIYYEHHDHSIIDFVDDDCLAEIFTYVPACERPKIALVCQKWKRALDYSWSNVKKLQLTHWEQAENPYCLKKYPTPDGKLIFLKSLLYKCGHYLTQLDLTAYGRSDIVPVINEYCPNLVKLRLRFTYNDDKLSWNSFSRLSKLKVLSITLQHKYDCISVGLIVSLLAVADTLTHLTLSNWKINVSKPCELPIDAFSAVLSRLKALKKLELGGVRIYPELAEYVKNSTLVCYSYDHYKIENDMKPNQLTSITSLNLVKWEITDEYLYVIANTMKHLRKFDISCESITNDGVVAISKMNNLLHLGFDGANDSIDSSSIKLLKNIIKLMLPAGNKITDDLATKVLENSPKMGVLFVLYSSVTVEFIKRAAEISKNRKQLLVLGVTFVADSKQYESPYIKILVVPDEN